jgi:hypothetical protein
MSTKPDKIRQNDPETKLTTRQRKFIPVLVGSPTYTEACKRGRVSRDTLYDWFKQPAFAEEVQARRDELVAQSFALLAQSVDKAVETLVGLLETKDDRVKRLAANDVISRLLRYKELAELEARLTAIEARLEAGQ